ncbi:MAG: HD domain-containing protein [Planctomycetaceae bacterium]|jgi:3'-5' exoribonuclease|nr:HD domain-containing protein [Planctomycetaceae bacterium]
MESKTTKILTLGEMKDGQEADAFVQLIEKESYTTRKGMPYFKTTFRDAARELESKIWNETPMFEDCRANWEVGQFYKIRTKFSRDPKFGDQLQVSRIRVATNADKQDGFDISKILPSTVFPREAMYDELMSLAAQHIGSGKLLNIVTRICKDYRRPLLDMPAARWNHHEFAGGLLEHTLSVTKVAIALCLHYETMYPHKKGAISRPLTVTGAILHDIGKIREMSYDAGTTKLTTEGAMIGHILIGRDIIREYAGKVELDNKTQLLLEHIIISHHRIPEWGSPKPPMSMEAVIVHHADSLDAMICMYENVQKKMPANEEVSTKNNMLGYSIYGGNRLQ